MKKFFNSVLAAALALTLVAGPAFAKGEAEFTDVAGIDEEAAILKLHALGAIQGYPDGDYHPEDELTRAQFAVILARALGVEKLAESMANLNTFPDTEVGYDWAKGAINLAAARGWINGYPNGNFGPGDTLTDEQMIAILVRAAGVKTEASEPWYVGPMLKAADVGIVYDAIEVGAGATRAKAAQAVLNMLEVPVLAGEYDAKDGVARITTISGEITATGSNQITVKYEDKDGDTQTATYSVKDIPVYGKLAKGATVELVIQNKKAVMAFVRNTTKTLAVVETGPDFIVVSEDGEEVIYYVASDIDTDDFSIGYFYDLTLNSDGEVISFKENAAAGTGIITSWKRTGADVYQITAGGKTFTFDSGATIEYKTVFLDEEINTSTAKPVADAWSKLTKGDKLVVVSYKGTKIDKAIVFASEIETTVEDIDGNEVTFDFTADAIDTRHRDFRNLEITKGDEKLTWKDLKKGMSVTLKLTLDKVNWVYDEDAAAYVLKGATKVASIAVEKAADIENKILSAVEFDSDGVITVTIDGTAYELASNVKVNKDAAIGNQFSGAKADLANYDFVTSASVKDGKITSITVYREKLEMTVAKAGARFNADGEVERFFNDGTTSGNPPVTTDYVLTEDAAIVKGSKTVKFSEVKKDANIDFWLNTEGKVYRIVIE